jgi:hypothetical protein
LELELAALTLGQAAEHAEPLIVGQRVRQAWPPNLTAAAAHPDGEA